MAVFYLGTHKDGWLAHAGVPLFVSHRTLADRRRLPRAVERWVLDSGGFTELASFGGWRTSPGDYVAAVRRYRDEVGRLDWAAPQDWMCEPSMLEKTGLTVADHQYLTVSNLLDLRNLAPDLPFVPVLQGWTRDDYLRCVDSYDRAGVDLTREATVGLGSVCRRHATGMVADLVIELHQAGIACHAFGLKTDGWARCRGHLVSADSMAWSYDARRAAPMRGHPHKSCANCLPYALRWRARHIARAWEPSLFTA